MRGVVSTWHIKLYDFSAATARRECREGLQNLDIPFCKFFGAHVLSDHLIGGKRAGLNRQIAGRG
jgi:hypothetical protein